MKKGRTSLKQAFPALVGLANAGFDPICRNAPGLVYTYSERESGYTDCIIALITFDLVAPSFGFGTCWAGLLHPAATSYLPLKEALGIPENFVLQYPVVFGYPKFNHRKIPERNKADTTGNKLHPVMLGILLHSKTLSTLNLDT